MIKSVKRLTLRPQPVVIGADTVFSHEDISQISRHAPDCRGTVRERATESVRASHKESAVMQQRLFRFKSFAQPALSVLAVAALSVSLDAGTYVPGTSEATVEAIESQLETFQNPRGSLRFNPGDRWPGTAGDPIVFTYSFALDGTQIGGEFDGAAGASNLFSQMDVLFADDTQQWKDAISNAFLQWEAVSGVQFVLVTDVIDEDNPDGADDGAPFSSGNAATNTRGEIRIGMKTFAGGLDGLCSVGLRRDPGTNDYGEIVLNGAYDWAQTNNNQLDFLTNCIAREIGVAIGLGVACPMNGTKLMEPVLPSFATGVGPRLDDIRSVHRLYGDTSVINVGGTVTDNFDRAHALPFVESELAAQVVIENLSLDKATEMDFYAFTLPDGGGLLTFGLFPQPFDPVDATYEDGPFVANVCQAGAMLDTTSIQDLRFEIQDDSGATLAGSETDETGLGGAEAIGGFNIPQQGTYYLVISSDMANDDVQLYTLIAFVDLGVPAADQIIHMKEVLPEIRFGALELRGDVDATGEDIVIANIEGGLPWPGHVAFGGSKFANLLWDGTDPATDRFTAHATGVVGVAAGQPDTDADLRFTGVAPEAWMVGSTIAQSIDPFGGFQISDQALIFSLFAVTDEDFMTQELGFPRAASVINLSWGALGDPTGESDMARFVDALVVKTGVLSVIAAGNAGSIDDSNFCGDGDPEKVGGAFIGARSIGAPATGYNSLSVGAVSTYWGQTAGSDNTVERSDKVTYFSSRGPIDSFNFDPAENEKEFNTRSGIHLVAPGTGFSTWSVIEDPRNEDACPYIGDWFTQRRMNLPWINPDDFSQIDGSLLPGADTSFFAIGFAEDPADNPGIPPSLLDKGGVEGTSFSAPIVAGIAALLQDAALKRGMSINSLVLRSILMTGARKAPGWSNNGLPSTVQMRRDGVEIEEEQVLTQQLATDTTNQPLDFLQGAGVLDASGAMQTYFGQLNIHEDATPAEIAAIQADPQPHDFYPMLLDSPLTKPKKPTVMHVDTNILPDPFPGSPGDVSTPSASTDTVVTQKQSRTPLQIAKMLHEADKGVDVSSRWRDWADVDPEIILPDPDIDGGGIGPAPVDGNPFIPPQIDRPIDNPPIPPTERPLILQDPIDGGRIGWDIANVGIRNVVGPPPNGGIRGHIDYRLGPYNIDINEFGSVEVLTATLVWDRYIKLKNYNWRNNNFNPDIEIKQLELENLDLQVFFEFAGDDEPIFVSNSTLNNVEHIYFPLPLTGSPIYIILRVRWQEQEYDLTNDNPVGGVKYAVSWRTRRFDDINAFRDSISVDAPPESAAPASPVSLQTVSSLIFNLGATDADVNFDSALDMDNNGVLNVNDISAMIFRLSSGN
jgi:hypothetical protein